MRILPLLFAAVLAAPADMSALQARPDRASLTADEFSDRHYENAYDAIEQMRGNWLRDRGPVSLNTVNPPKLLVYLDNVNMGGIDALKSIPINIIARMKRLDGVEAQARYGVGHSLGVIYVETHMQTPRDHEPVLLEGNEVITRTATAADGFILSAKHASAPIVVGSEDYAGVIRAARDLRSDVKRVTDAEPSFSIDTLPKSGRAVIIGTIGRSAMVDRLIREGKLSAAGVTGKWESYVRQVVNNPAPGISQALVIAGSDKRGTIYGIYDLSSAIGVSPWQWWADVTPRHQDDLYVATARVTQGEPAVKYRGIFINDEAPNFSGWTKEKFGGVNHVMYEKMFELILRMKGNYLWPAMWGNAFADDDSLNAVKADEYGIVMGTSHHEPMTRAQQEWKRYGQGEWDYGKNDTTLRAFWKKGIERMMNTGGTPRENIVTLGMRGDGDRPMTTNGESNVTLLEHIVADQRKILADVTGKDPSKTPTLWALYKEVQDYYDKGMRVPDDVTLLFSDDNWGNIRRLPTAADRNRPGGFGIYYHFDYVGGPRNYKWINTNPISRVCEQMHLANEYGANRIWVVNVGDLKPMEFPIQFFLDYAWNPSKWPAERLPEYTKEWAAQQFGDTHAAQIGEIVTRTLKYAGRRKPELLAPETYSLSNYREAETVIDEYRVLRRDAETVGATIPADLKDAYYELVLHPVLAAQNLNEMYVAVARNHVYAQQGRASTNAMADSVRRLFENDAAISRFYNKQLAGGKWSHMMDQTHIGYTIWQEPQRNMMPRVDMIEVPEGSEMGVSYEGQSFGPPVFGGGGGGPGRGGFRAPALPDFDAYNRQSYYLDIYDKRNTPFEYSVEAAQPWVMISAPKGTVDKEVRVTVSIDWAKAPAGTTVVPVTVMGPNGTKFTVQATVKNPVAPARASVDGFVEANGYVSMEAAHYTRAVSTGGIQWTTIPDLGRTLSAVMPSPVTAPAQTVSTSSAHLEYRMFTFDSGAVTVRAYVSPTLNFAASKTGLRYAVSIDDEAPQIVNVLADEGNKAWEQAVSDNVWMPTSKHTVAHAGEHVLKFWMVDPGVVLQKLVVDAGGVKPSYLGPPESYRGSPAVSRK